MAEKCAGLLQARACSSHKWEILFWGTDGSRLGRQLLDYLWDSLGICCWKPMGMSATRCPPHAPLTAMCRGKKKQMETHLSQREMSLPPIVYPSSAFYWQSLKLYLLQRINAYGVHLYHLRAWNQEWIWSWEAINRLTGTGIHPFDQAQFLCEIHDYFLPFSPSSHSRINEQLVSSFELLY